MHGSVRLGGSAILLLLFAGLPTRAAAQAELQAWVSPELGKLIGRGDYRLTVFPDERVKGQSTAFGFLQHNATLVVPLWQDPRDEWSISARTRFVDTDTRAILPDTRKPFPDELWDVRFGASYRHRFDDGWIGAASVTVGSASDEPFNSAHELIVHAIGFLRVPHRERHAWLFSLIYANDQEILAGFPIPGIAYSWEPSERLRVVIGFPFSSVQAKPVERLTLELSYLPLRIVYARATYELFRPLRVYVGFDWDHDHYFLAGRGDKDDRLFYYDQRFTAGARFDLRHVGVEVFGGYAFDRFYFEGETYSDRRENRIDVEAGPFFAIRIGVRW